LIELFGPYPSLSELVSTDASYRPVAGESKRECLKFSICRRTIGPLRSGETGFLFENATFPLYVDLHIQGRLWANVSPLS
jgi:hypothetical protein